MSMQEIGCRVHDDRIVIDLERRVLPAAKVQVDKVGQEIKGWSGHVCRVGLHLALPLDQVYP